MLAGHKSLEMRLTQQTNNHSISWRLIHESQVHGTSMTGFELRSTGPLGARSSHTNLAYSRNLTIASTFDVGRPVTTNQRAYQLPRNKFIRSISSARIVGKRGS